MELVAPACGSGAGLAGYGMVPVTEYSSTHSIVRFSRFYTSQLEAFVRYSGYITMYHGIMGPNVGDLPEKGSPIHNGNGERGWYCYRVVTDLTTSAPVIYSLLCTSGCGKL